LVWLLLYHGAVHRLPQSWQVENLFDSVARRLAAGWDSNCDEPDFGGQSPPESGFA